MSAGQSLISVLVAIFVIALIAVGILGLSVLTTRLLVGAERHVAALAVLNERKEFIEALPYRDVGFVTPGAGEPPGVIAVGTESVNLNNQTYQLSTTIQYVDDPLTAEADDYKRVEFLVEWETASEATRDAQVVTYISEKSEPKTCVACPDGRSCDATTGICDPPEGADPPGAGTPCTPGLLCDNGELCPLTGFCPSGIEVPDVPGEGEACVPARLCNNGALCPLSGVCPVTGCPDWTCPSGSACFGGYCYPWDWYELTFVDYDQGNPGDSTAMICEDNRCANTLDCPANCQTDCQYIESSSFAGCGRWQVLRQCQMTWVPDCRTATEGGATASCRGGYDAGGNCPGLECNPVPCPVPDPLVDPNRSWCANGQECHISSSNTACAGDEGCPSGELCGPSGACRTICPDDAACSYYWGGWTRGCSVEVVAEGPAGCADSGGGCTGPAGSCDMGSSLPLVSATIENVDPNDPDTVLADPVEVGEGASPDLTGVAFRVTLSGPILDTVTVRVDLQDGEATQADNDYSGTDITLTFEPGDPLSQVVLADVIGDSVVEGDESFRVVLVEARSNAHDVQMGLATATVLIVDDDPQPINFNDYTIESYGGGQDASGSVTVEDGGSTLHMVGNLWKKISFPYVVTADTVLEFDFKSTVQGEIHGIGFDVDNSISSGYTFRVYGTQGWGIGAFANYGGSAPDWKHYTIPVGQYYTGSMNYLIFAMDHDGGSSNGENYFRDVAVYESD